MNVYGFTIPAKGRALLAKLLAGETLEITRTMVGTGKIRVEDNPLNLEELVSPLARATVTVPTIRNSTASFIVEYRSDMNGGLGEGKYINEFGVFARDPDEGEVLLYYGSLGDYPQYVPAYRAGTVGILRYPVAISLAAEDIDIALEFDASAFMTAEDIDEYIRANSMPEILGAAQSLIQEHNTARNAHQDIRSATAQLSANVQRLEDMLLSSITGNPFIVDFGDLEGIEVEGVWNRELGRIEF